MRDLAGHPELLSMNTATFGPHVQLGEAVEHTAAAGFGAIAPWRQIVDEKHPERSAKLIRDAGLKVSGYCRTAYLNGSDEAERTSAREENERALHAAAALEAECYVAVVGGLMPGSKDTSASRAQIIDELALLGETAADLGVPIALEPLHPNYAADRSLLNTMAQAAHWVDLLAKASKGQFGVCVDAYHVWWDPDAQDAISSLPQKPLCFQVCDWLVPTADPLLDRGMPGDGVIDLPSLRAAAEQAGFSGFVEVEIFSRDNWWKREPAEVAAICRDRMLGCC